MIVIGPTSTLEVGSAEQHVGVRIVSAGSTVISMLLTPKQVEQLRAELLDAMPKTRPRCGVPRVVDGHPCRRFVAHPGGRCHDHQKEEA